MEQLFNANIKRIKDASLANKLVVFVGAGVSMNSGVPGWGSLIKTLFDELPKNIEESETDFLKVAQLYKNQRESKEYIEKIRFELKNGNIKFNPIHEILFKLKPVHIVTTNYDDLLEQAMAHNNYQYFKIVKDRDLPYATYNKFLIKMHGDLNEGNIVLTEDDYLNYSIQFPLIETFVKSLFASKLILFIGFSFTDYNLKIITNNVKYLLKDDFQPMYLLNTGSTDAIQTNYFEKRGVKVLDYSNLIDNQFNSKSLLHEKEDLKKLSNEKGQQLYKFITYILKFNSFKETHKSLNLISLLYKTIEYYFSELKVIGGRKIIKFYPFTEDSKATYSYFQLVTSIKEFEELSEKLKMSFKAKREFLVNYGLQYRAIISFAKINNIEWITIEGTGTGTEIESKTYKLPSIFSYNKKDGIDFFHELDITKVYNHIDKLKLESYKSEVSNKDLELPFLLYKIGSFYESYLLFHSLAQKYWVNEKYILYFICQINIKRLAHLLWNIGLEASVFQSIRDESQKIDIADILSRIEIKDVEIYKELQSISDNSHIDEIIFSINTLTDGIKESDKIVREGGFSGNGHVDELLEKIAQVWNFTNNNFIISEHFTKHKFIYRKAFEGFVISNSIPETSNLFSRGSSKLKELYPFHITIILFSADTKFLIQIFEDHDITSLTFNKSHKNFITKLILNAIKSIDLLNNNRVQIKNNNLEKTLYTALGNLFCISAKIDLDKDVINNLISQIHKSTIDLYKIEKSLRYFVNHKSISINKDNLSHLLLKAFKFVNPRSTPAQLLWTLLDNIRLHDPNYTIKDIDVLKRIIQNDYLENFLTRNILLSFFSFIPKSYQKLINQKINQLLSTKYDNFVFTLAYENGINLNSNLYEEFLIGMQSYFSGNTTSSQDSSMINVLYKIYKSTDDISIKTRIGTMSEKSHLLRFLINKNNYNFKEEFEIEWLELLDDKELRELSRNPQLKSVIEHELIKSPQNRWLLRLYFKYFGCSEY